MDDSISRQAAIRWVKTECNPYGKPTLDFESGKKVIEHLEQMPSAQPERKKGRWIRHDEIRNVYGGICIECSECGEKYVVQHIEDEKYCRNCGADMRGGRDD